MFLRKSIFENFNISRSCQGTTIVLNIWHVWGHGDLGASRWACLDAHNSEEYFATRLRPWGGNLTYVPQFSVRMVATPSTKQQLSFLHEVCLSSWACDTHDLGAMEYEVGLISLSQELTNFFSLNLELWKFMSRSLNILVGARDLRPLWSRFVFCFFLWNFGGNKTKQKRQSCHIYRIRSWRSPKKYKAGFYEISIFPSRLQPIFTKLWFSFLFFPFSFLQGFFFVSLFVSSSFLEQIQAKNPK